MAQAQLPTVHKRTVRNNDHSFAVPSLWEFFTCQEIGW